MIKLNYAFIDSPHEDYQALVSKNMTYATPGSAAIDLYAYQIWFDEDKHTVTAYTGLAFEIPKNYFMAVYPRSGLAVKHGVSLVNSVAVIDSDYRGELILHFNVPKGKHPIKDGVFQKGKAVAQFIISPCPRVKLQELAALPKTKRGDGGFGSTDSK